MPRQSMSVKDAARVAARVAEEQKLELVDVELNKEPTGHVLRFYIDTPNGITLDEIETFHRAVRPLVEDVEYDYMEVSSPGVDRPLKTERDFEKAKGLAVELKTYRPVNGAKLFKGDLVGLVEGNVVIRVNDDGAELSFPQKEVAVVRRLIEFDESDLRDETPEDNT